MGLPRQQALEYPRMNETLENPFWSALTSIHRNMALGSNNLLRYPADVAPFAAVPSSDAPAGEEIEQLLAPGEEVYFIGTPPSTRTHWKLHELPPIAQMLCETSLAVEAGPEIIALDSRHRQDVLALTARVFPHYFRSRTMASGDYFGIYQGGRLAAMIGTRAGDGRCREVSAICTEPEFSGRGLARRLTAWLTNNLIDQGILPFLHVSHQNERAKLIYQALGYRLRCDVGLWKLYRE